MRGCLFVLILGAAILGGAAWFGSPVLASAVIANALDGSGFTAATRTVKATADPPPRLLTGRADRVEIEATDVDFRTFHAAALDLVLTDVDLFARTAGGISGTIDDAAMRTNEGVAAEADVTVEGSGRDADATIIVDAATVERVVTDAFQREFDISVTDVVLVEPDILRVSAGPTSVEGRLEVDATGAISLGTPIGSAAILAFDPTFPLRLESLRVDEGNLEVDGVLDATALLGG